MMESRGARCSCLTEIHMGTESETASSARRERILGRLQETAMAFVVADESIPHVAIGSVTVHLAGGRTDGFAWLTCEPDDYMPKLNRDG